jgi:hypothetical protein
MRLLISQAQIDGVQTLVSRRAGTGDNAHHSAHVFDAVEQTRKRQSVIFTTHGAAAPGAAHRQQLSPRDEMGLV